MSEREMSPSDLHSKRLRTFRIPPVTRSGLAYAICEQISKAAAGHSIHALNPRTILALQEIHTLQYKSALQRFNSVASR
jgi:hypothetical protein